MKLIIHDIKLTMKENRPDQELLKSIRTSITTDDLARVSAGEVSLAATNTAALEAATIKIRNLGLFPILRVALDSSEADFDISDHPLMFVAHNPDTRSNKKVDIYLDSNGKMHLCNKLPREDSGGEDVVDFRDAQRADATKDHIIISAKQAIKGLVGILNRTISPPSAS